MATRIPAPTPRAALLLALGAIPALAAAGALGARGIALALDAAVLLLAVAEDLLPLVLEP